jgi:hypothetical protein
MLDLASGSSSANGISTPMRRTRWAQDVLTKARLLEPPNFDARDPNKNYTPPGHLNLNIIPRRIP